MKDFEHQWEAPFRDAHNTTLRMNNLEQALNEHPEHPLYDQAYALGQQILHDWSDWSGAWICQHESIMGI